MLRATGHARMVKPGAYARCACARRALVRALQMLPFKCFLRQCEKSYSHDQSPSRAPPRVVGLQPTVIASRPPHLLHDSKNRGRASPVNAARAQGSVDTIRHARILNVAPKLICT